MRHFLLLCLGALVAFSSCDKSRQQLIGKWKAESGSGETVWEFSDNGTVTTGGTPGRYTFGDNKRLKIQTSAATFVYQYELAGDRMIWTDPGGSKMELSRIK